MTDKLIQFSLKNRWTIVIISLALLGIGFWCFKQLKIEAYPDIADTNVVIVCEYPGKATEEVEQQITIPLELALQSTPKVIDRRSRTIYGLAVIQLSFEDGVDDYFARQRVLENIANASLPDGVTPQLAPLSTAIGEIFRYVVEAPVNYSQIQLRDLQDWVIKPAILQVPGIADVTTFGGPLKQFHILMSPESLRKFNIDIDDVIEAIETNNQNTGGNIVARGEQGFAIRGLGAIKNENDINHIVLKTYNQSPIFIKDIGSVEITPPQPSGVLGYTINADSTHINSGVEGIVLLRRYENPGDVLKLLKEKLQELQENELPPGVILRPLYDRSFLINHSLQTVSETLFQGISIVIILLIFFLGSLRSALVVAICIPFSLLFAFILMKLKGVPANLLSLGAIDFGIIVDGACIMVEHLIRKYQNATMDERKRGIIPISIQAAQEVSREILFSISIIILAYLPILLMSRIEGKLFSPMALTLAFAVIGSLLAALILIPVLISFAFQKKFNNASLVIKNSENIILKKISSAYTIVLKKIMKHYKISVITGFVILLIGLAMGTKLGSEFLPNLDEGSLFLRANFPSGITLQENASYAPKIRETIAQHAPVAFVISQSGRNDDGTDPFPANRNEILIGLKDYSLWTDTLSKKALARKIQNELNARFPSVAFSLGQPIIDQVMEIVTGSAADLAIQIIGNDLKVLRLQADSIQHIVKSITGAENTNIEQEGTQEQLAISINRENAARYGINIATINAFIEAAIGGKTISTLYDENKRYDIVIRFLPQFRNSIDVIKNLQIRSANGALIPLNQLAQINFVAGQTNIYRYNSKRMITVRTNIVHRDQGGFVKELQSKINKTIELPKGYRVEYGGQYQNLERASKKLTFTIPLTILVVFLFLYWLYGQLSSVLITMSCIVFAVVGGISALLLRGYYFNVSAGVGFVSIFGISVMAGVILVSAFN
ncbi:MAG: CusA/CzcA family heavy metal efflux RND transporter, partial [Alphaproteobacteria bacterium]|nr:CusA/CzcA family heavy metal efflux RND transporter [Alphaproteobacteria bacterium]